jgi:hypothetical protein
MERECQRNVELMWLTGRLAPDSWTIADFRHNYGTGIRNVCCHFVMQCRELKLFSQALVAINGSKFKAVNTRDRNFTAGKFDKRQKRIEESIRQPAELEAKPTRLQDKIARLREQMRNLDQIKEQLKIQPDGQLSMTNPDALHGDTRQGLGNGGLQRAGGRWRQTLSHRGSRGHKLWQLAKHSLALWQKLRATRWEKKRLRAFADRGYYTGTHTN